MTAAQRRGWTRPKPPGRVSPVSLQPELYHMINSKPDTGKGSRMIRINFSGLSENPKGNFVASGYKSTETTKDGATWFVVTEE